MDEQKAKIEKTKQGIANACAKSLASHGTIPNAPPNSRAEHDDRWLDNHSPMSAIFTRPGAPEAMSSFGRTRLERAQIEVNRVMTTIEISDAISKGKSNSTPGKDEISYRALSLLDESGLQQLTDIFNACFDHGKCPTEFRTAQVRMLFKLNPVTAKDKTTDVSNYRGISLLSCVGKTYERVLHSRISHLVEVALPGLDDAQNGFRRNRDCITHILTLAEAIRMAGKDTFACFLDIRKAFPTARRSSLLRCLYDAGCAGKAWAAVASLYDKNESVVMIHDIESDESYDVKNGVREGAILSPLLYILFINRLLTQLRSTSAGLSFPHPFSQQRMSLNALCYADDLVLLASSSQDMQALLDVCDKFAHDHAFHFGYSKTRYTIFNPRSKKPIDVHLILKSMHGAGNDPNPTQVRHCTGYTYLGVYFHNSLTWTEHTRRTIIKCNSKLASLRAALTNYNMLSPTTSTDILDSFVRSMTRSSGAVWMHLDAFSHSSSCVLINSKERSRMITMYHSTLRAIVGIAGHASMQACKKDLGWTDDLETAALTKIRLYHNIMKMPNTRTARLFLIHRMSTVFWSSQNLRPQPISKNDTASFFLSDVTHIILAIQGQSAARKHMANPQPFTWTEAKISLPLHIKRYVACKLNCTFATSQHSSWQLHRHGAPYKWEMAPYLRKIQNGSISTSHLVLAQFRTHGHVLGTTIDKLYRSDTPPHCHRCGTPCKDTTEHALHCTETKATAARQLYLPRILHAMRGSSWKTQYDQSTNPIEKTSLTLDAPNHKAPYSTAEQILTLVSAWLESIRKEHPIYSIFLKGKGVKAASVKYQRFGN
jgi:hypothetical protein